MGVDWLRIEPKASTLMIKLLTHTASIGNVNHTIFKNFHRSVCALSDCTASVADVRTAGDSLNYK